MPTRYQPPLIRHLYEQVRSIWEATEALEHEFAAEIDTVPIQHRPSARNLVHYLAVRRRDIRALQVELAHLGLSSLGRLEAHVAAALEAVLLALGRIAPEPLPPLPPRPRPTFFREGDERLARHADALFGPPRSSHGAVRIMVTLPTEAAADYAMVRDLVGAGMDVARINTAHDDDEIWQRMAANVHAAAAEHGRSVRVLMDLAGPKLRTGAVEPGPPVLRARVRRDARGNIVEPAVVRIAGEGTATDEGQTPRLRVDEAFVRQLRVGDHLRLRDLPGRKRALEVIHVDGSVAALRVPRTTWFETGQALTLVREGEEIARATLGPLPRQRGFIRLRVGDLLVVDSDPAPGRDGEHDTSGRLLAPARIGCTLPSVFAEVEVGDRVLLDDGIFEGRVEAAHAGALHVRITRTPPGGGKLRADKGINLPDSDLTLPSLSEEDLHALDFATRHAELVGLSFVRTSADLEALHEALAERRADALGVIVKIETRHGFENLPQILLTALRRPPVGVMVARGDLGVEVEFERMAEAQEEILWLCEAAHVPVIWATQVLEGLAKTGIPTRGEVTDAAMSSRAECVMLNKGPFILDAVRFLDDVLVRMRDHHIKKTPMLRRLKISEGRWAAEPGDDSP